MQEITAEYARSRLIYEPETGVIRRRESTSKGPSGEILGWIDRHGYRCIRISRSIFRAHRLAWLITHGKWPEGEIDHINRIKHDNRLENLRDVSHRQNLSNRNFGSGIPGRRATARGYSWEPEKQRYRAQIRVGKKVIKLGRFSTEHEAHAAFLDARNFYAEKTESLKPAG